MPWSFNPLALNPQTLNLYKAICNAHVGLGFGLGLSAWGLSAQGLKV